MRLSDNLPGVFIQDVVDSLVFRVVISVEFLRMPLGKGEHFDEVQSVPMVWLGGGTRRQGEVVCLLFCRWDVRPQGDCEVLPTTCVFKANDQYAGSAVFVK